MNAIVPKCPVMIYSLLSFLSLFSCALTYSFVDKFFRDNHFITKNGDNNLRKCEKWQVCSKLDTYSNPWTEKYCRCGKKQCSTSLNINDGHTIEDKTRQLKICENVSKLNTCRYFKDITWSLISYPDNTTLQRIECKCPDNSIAYLIKHQPIQTNDGIAYRYLFACSPKSHLRCQLKEPCRLFTVKKRPLVEEVNTNTLCECPSGYECPSHHNHSSVLPSSSYPLDHIRIFTGYCGQNTLLPFSPQKLSSLSSVSLYSSNRSNLIQNYL